jgi:tRNA(Ile)-lysidine synthase
MARPARARVRAAIRAGLSDLHPGSRIVVGLSGGPDSLALLAGTVRVAAEAGLLCTAAVIDHGLQARSGEIAARARGQALLLGCQDSRVIRIQVAQGTRGPEAAARDARRAALMGVALEAPEAAAILLGHTLDDQAESVLLGLARGSGTRSLSGMSGRDDPWRRPLLGVPRAVVAVAAEEAAAEDSRLEPWRDPHNVDPRYSRSRVRAEIMPVLEQALGPGIAAALARSARRAREDADALDGWAERHWSSALGMLTLEGESGGGALPGAFLIGVDGERLPEAVATRLLRRFLLATGVPANALTAEHVWRVAGLMKGPSRAVVALPGGRQAQRVREVLRVTPSATWRQAT